MTMEHLLETIRGLDGVLELAPVEGSALPEIASGDLDRPDRWRVNIHVTTDAFTELTGQHPGDAEAPTDFAANDTVLPHPVYRRQGWLSVINPAARTHELVIRLLQQAHDDAKRRAQRRHRSGGDL